MTNEQLALLLRAIAAQVRKLATDIEPLITDGERSLKRVWIGEGEPPLISSVGKGWELQRVGRFKAIDLVESFADTLETDADLLLGKETDD